MSKLACSRGVAPTPRFGAVAAYLGTQQAPRSHSELPSGLRVAPSYAGKPHNGTKRSLYRSYAPEWYD